VFSVVFQKEDKILVANCLGWVNSVDKCSTDTIDELVIDLGLGLDSKLAARAFFDTVSRHTQSQATALTMTVCG